MKLIELKSALIQQFFTDRKDTVEVPISEVITVLGKQLQEDASPLIDTCEPIRSHEPSKAFTRFTSGTRAALIVEEEEPYKRVVIFGALRSGTRVVTVNLTDGKIPQVGTLGQVKEALHQAKAFNDDVCYSIYNENPKPWEIKLEKKS